MKWIPSAKNCITDCASRLCNYPPGEEDLEESIEEHVCVQTTEPTPPSAMDISACSPDSIVTDGRVLKHGDFTRPMQETDPKLIEIISQNKSDTASRITRPCTYE